MWISHWLGADLSGVVRGKDAAAFAVAQQGWAGSGWTATFVSLTIYILYIYIYLFTYLCYPPPKIYHFQLFVDVKEVVCVGNLLQKQSRYTITFKKDEHILRSESTTFLEGSNLF